MEVKPTIIVRWVGDAALIHEYPDEVGGILGTQYQFANGIAIYWGGPDNYQVFQDGILVESSDESPFLEIRNGVLVETELGKVIHPV